MNIRVDLNYPIKDGTEVVFRSPVDCSRVTGLKVYYPENGNTASKEFAFSDAHGNNVGDIDHLFAENVVVKVILDVATSMAFVQNADTNAYLEGRFAEMERAFYTTPRKKIDVSYDEINTEYIWSLYRTLGKQYPGHVQEIDYSIGDFEQHAFVISTGEYPTEGYYTKDEGYGGDPHIKKPKYLLLSGIHGIERKAVFSAYRFIQDVLSGHNVPRDFKEGAIICVMPVGNPDGFDKFTYENEDGVNINRDFDEIEKGTAAKQTQAIANWLAQNKDAELFIDFHNSSSVNEIVAILGCSDNNVIDSAKRVALRGIDRVIPFWKTIITDTKVGTPVYDSNGNWQHNEEKDVIFAYSASLSMQYNLKELAIGYATIVLGIPSIAIETLVYCGDYYPELATEPDYQPQAIALGAEALGNVLLEFYNQALSFRPDAIIKTNVTPAYNGEVVITNTSETQKRFYNGEVK